MNINGNKVRKLQFLQELINIPQSESSSHNNNKENFKTTLFGSFGGYQSNSMVAISKVLSSQNYGSNFVYFTKNIPKKQIPSGNLEIALSLGTKVNII